MYKVTFDFDNTLSRPDVQEFAKFLLGSGIDVWVLTMRYDELHKHKWTADPCNQDLYDVIEEVGIPKHKVRFCNLENWQTCNDSKAKYLQGTDVIFHIDDSVDELESFKDYKNTKTLPIQVRQPHWKLKCLKAINNYKKYGRGQKS